MGKRGKNGRDANWTFTERGDLQYGWGDQRLWIQMAWVCVHEWAMSLWISFKPSMLLFYHSLNECNSVLRTKWDN